MNAQRAATANVLGALALTIATQLSESASAGSDLAALSALDQFLDGTSINRLHDALGLTHSGTVRLVQRLATARLVRRGPGVNGRTRAVALTPRGRRAARRIADQRAAYLESVLGDLSPHELAQLHNLLERLAKPVVQLKAGGAWICRRCDLEVCGRNEGRCPIATAAAEKYGAPA